MNRERVDSPIETRFYGGELRNGNHEQEIGQMMTEAVLVFFGLIIVAIVNFLGFRQIAKTLEETRK